MMHAHVPIIHVFYVCMTFRCVFIVEDLRARALTNFVMNGNEERWWIIFSCIIVESSLIMYTEK